MDDAKRMFPNVGEIMTKKKIYYAHPVSTYDSQIEAADIAVLEMLGKVINPNSPEHERMYRELGMPYFLDLLKECEMLAFRAFPGGKISSGVYKEILEARELGLPVFELPSSCFGKRALTKAETYAYLDEIGHTRPIR